MLASPDVVQPLRVATERYLSPGLDANGMGAAILDGVPRTARSVLLRANAPSTAMRYYMQWCVLGHFVLLKSDVR
jgi:hypothetical protein